jgi:hypothetical protein
MDEAVEATAPMGTTFGMRLFDAGAFHVGFGIVAPADEETIDFSVKGKTLNGRLPFRYSLAVTLYGDSLRAGLSLTDRVKEALASLLGRFTGAGADSHRMRDPSLPFRKAKPRRRN